MTPADDKGDTYDSGGYSQSSGKEWPSVKWPTQVVEIMYLECSLAWPDPSRMRRKGLATRDYLE